MASHEVSSHSLPLVTIAIPTFNRSGMLSLAIDSAFSQTHPRFEVLVCDNASSDDTSQILKSIADTRLRYVRHGTNIGLVANWNSCVQEARGEYILMLSDDDRLAPQAIEDLLETLRGGAPHDTMQIAFAYGSCEILRKHGGLSSISSAAPPLERSIAFQIGVLRSERVSYPSATLLRTADVRAVGGYNSKFSAAIDTGLLFEISSTYSFVACTGTTTTYYLLHQDNFTTSIPLEALHDTYDLLLSITLKAAANDSSENLAEAEKASRQATARALAFAVVEHKARGQISFTGALAALSSYRRSFRSAEGLWLMGKAIIKLLLDPLLQRVRRG